MKGALALDLGHLRKQAKSIRRLVTLGAVLTAAGGTLAVWFWMKWPWQLALLFGTLVIVTGPTVVQPIVRRIKLQQEVATVLEAEGIFGDAIGAIVAAVTLELVIDSQDAGSLASSAIGLIARIGLGALLGIFAGAALGAALRSRKWIAEGLENVFVLACVLAIFEGSNWLLPDSGIMSVSAAGLMLAN